MDRIRLRVWLSMTMLCWVLASISSRGEAPAPAASGRFTILTYNVAGLPQGISQSQPLWYMKEISPRLNSFDIVVT